MKRTLLLIPLLGISAFGAYYVRWDGAHTLRIEAMARDPLAKYAFRDGRSDALATLARGERRLLEYGPAAEESDEYRGLLSRVYHIDVETITDDAGTRESRRYVAAYNAVMEEEIAHVFGPGTLADARALAQRSHAVNQRVASYTPPI